MRIGEWIGKIVGYYEFADKTADACVQLPQMRAAQPVIISTITPAPTNSATPAVRLTQAPTPTATETPIATPTATGTVTVTATTTETETPVVTPTSASTANVITGIDLLVNGQVFSLTSPFTGQTLINNLKLGDNIIMIVIHYQNSKDKNKIIKINYDPDLWKTKTTPTVSTTTIVPTTTAQPSAVQKKQTECDKAGLHEGWNDQPTGKCAGCQLGQGENHVRYCENGKITLDRGECRDGFPGCAGTPKPNLCAGEPPENGFQLDGCNPNKCGEEIWHCIADPSIRKPKPNNAGNCGKNQYNSACPVEQQPNCSDVYYWDNNTFGEEGNRKCIYKQAAWDGSNCNEQFYPAEDSKCP